MLINIMFLLGKADTYRAVLLILIVIGIFRFYQYVRSLDLKGIKGLNRFETLLIRTFFIAVSLFVIAFFLTFGFEGFHALKFAFGRFSTDMGDWGDFATCAAGVLAFVSVVLAFNAFKSQQLALKRNSFDSLFSQMFAQHVKLYEKVGTVSGKGGSNNDNNGKDVFRYYYDIIKNKKGDITKEDIPELWKKLENEGKDEDANSVCFMNLRNYCKYIYHEINLIREYQKEGVLLDTTAKKYVLLIQAQMNNYELLCYLLNQYDYYLKSTDEKKDELKKYFEYLRDNAFFKDMAQADDFKELVEKLRNAVEIFLKGNNNPIDKEWCVKPNHPENS